MHCNHGAAPAPAKSWSKERWRCSDVGHDHRSVVPCGIRTRGVTSIAHPTFYPNHLQLVPTLLDSGVDGVEVFHPDVDDAWRDAYISIARFRGKMTTGGSDDHGTVKEVETLGSIRVPENLISPILERMEG